MASVNKLYTAISVLAVIGIFLAVYLFWEYLIRPPVSPCYLNAVVNCEASTRGVLAKTLGIPTALWGLGGYLIIFLTAVLRRQKLVVGMATFGLFFCLRITFLEIFVIKQICPICLACQIVMLTIFILSLRLSWAKKR